MKFYLCIFLSCLTFFNLSFSFAKPNLSCEIYFSPNKASLNAQHFAQIAKTQFSKIKGLHKNARGYAIIMATMLSTAGISSFISAHIAQDYPFMTYFISQVSILGIVVIGAPIWEPISSYFRSLAFNLKKNSSLPQNSYLESMWFESQEKLSINSQMSRNIIATALSHVQVLLFEAHKAFAQNEEPYAIRQIASIAVRLRKLFVEVRPDDEHVALAFRTIFTNKNPDLKSKILHEISVLDRDLTSESLIYYETLLKAWLD